MMESALSISVRSSNSSEIDSAGWVTLGEAISLPFREAMACSFTAGFNV
jgi:hypothetical protein